MSSVRQITPESRPDRSVGIMGAGYIGAVLAGEFAHRGANVTAVDVSRARIDAINSGTSPVPEPGLCDLIGSGVRAGRLVATSDVAALAGSSTILLTVGTPLGEGTEADLTHLRAAVEQLAEVIADGTLVLVKSTVPPGTTTDVVAPLLRAKKRVFVAFSPERLAEGTAIADMRRLPVVVGGVDAASTARGVEFWTEHGFEAIEVADARAAELVKLADNAWIDLNIAFAHELAMLCDRVGADVLDVIRAANTLPKGGSMVNILLPSVGVGGYCLTKDPWFLDALGKELDVPLSLSAAGRTVNEASPEYLWARTKAALGDAVNGARVAVLGIAFKNNTGDTRFSPAIDYARAAERDGAKVTWFDDLVPTHDIPDDLLNNRADTWEEAVQGANAIAWLAVHDSTKSLRASDFLEYSAPNPVLADGRRFLNAVEREEFVEAGIAVHGVGW